MNFQVVVSEKAQEELQEIYDYIADTGFPQTAEKVIAELKEAILSLNVNFQRFPTLDAKKLVNAPKMSAHHRGICHF